MKINKEIFRAYDIRGIYPEEINEKISYLVGKSYANYIKPKKVIVGRDVRQVSRNMEKELIRGLIEQGVDVYEIGQITTDMLYFAVGFYNFDGGITASASHNPPEYGGLKLVREKAIPVTGNSGLEKIKELVKKNNFEPVKKPGKIFKKDIFNDYKKFVLSFIDLKNIKPQKVVFNTLGGAMGPIIEKISEDLPLEIIWLEKEVDPEVKKGEPNPFLPERRKDTILKIKKEKNIDFGVSWDGDGDRCIFFDENGEFIPVPFITSLIIEHLAKNNPGLKVITDPRSLMPIKYTAKKNGIELFLSKAGRTYIQQELRKRDAYLGAEIVGHYIFKYNYYSDLGILPFLIILKYLSESGKKLSELVKPLREQFFLIDEVKIKTNNLKELIKKLKNEFKNEKQNFKDGLSIESSDWRFNIRTSNTESETIKLNLEAKSKELLEKKKEEILEIIKN